MKNFDPTILFVLFGVLFFAGMFDIPWIIVGFIFYMIYRSSTRKKRKPRDPRPRARRDYQREDRKYSRRYDPNQRKRREEQRRPTSRSRQTTTRKVPKDNPFRSSGLAKFKDYDYEGAIEDFKKALQINNEDIAVHFNLACAYSLMEQKEKSLYHLDRAVGLGFKDFEKIKNHDALAYLRIQDEFEAFEKNGFRLKGSQSNSQRAEGDAALLEQLQKLAELREKGLLTEEEFLFQKKKLLG